MSVEAPETIWAYPSNVASWKMAYGSDREILGASVYVRADKLEELAAENKRLTKSLDENWVQHQRVVKAEAALAEKDKKIARLEHIVARYGDRSRMSFAPSELQQDIDDAFAARNAGGNDAK